MGSIYYGSGFDQKLPIKGIKAVVDGLNDYVLDFNGKEVVYLLQPGSPLVTYTLTIKINRYGSY